LTCSPAPTDGQIRKKCNAVDRLCVITYGHQIPILYVSWFSDRGDSVAESKLSKSRWKLLYRIRRNYFFHRFLVHFRDFKKSIENHLSVKTCLVELLVGFDGEWVLGALTNRAYIPCSHENKIY
jgi:hypothetical protein